MSDSATYPQARENTRATLIAFAAGIAAGALGKTADLPGLGALADFAARAGSLWTSALLVIVFPLVVCLLVTGLAGTEGRLLGRLGGTSLAVFIILLIAGAVLTVATTPLLLRWMNVTPGVLRGSLNPSAAAPAPPEGGGMDLFIGSIAGNDLLVAILVTIVFALALTRVGDVPKQRLLDLFDALLRVILVCLSWILLATPVAVFLLAFAASARSGFPAAHALLAFIVISVALLVAFTLFLYPVATLAGRVPLRDFAASALPAQAVATSTRSSLASLPALLKSGAQLRLPPAANAFVMPLAVSVFKANRTISGCVKLFFLAWVYGIELAPATIAGYAVATIFLSFASPGTPGAGFFTSTAPLLAAGIPIEGIALLRAVDDIPDIFKTITNVTADLTATAIVVRFAGFIPASEPIEQTGEAV